LLTLRESKSLNPFSVSPNTRPDRCVAVVKML